MIEFIVYLLIAILPGDSVKTFEDGSGRIGDPNGAYIVWCLPGAPCAK